MIFSGDNPFCEAEYKFREMQPSKHDTLAWGWFTVGPCLLGELCEF